MSMLNSLRVKCCKVYFIFFILTKIALLKINKNDSQRISKYEMMFRYSFHILCMTLQDRLVTNAKNVKRSLS
jgi:hypothetical protein